MSSSPTRQGPPGPRDPQQALALKLFSPSADTPVDQTPPRGASAVWPTMSLRQFYDAYVKPCWAIERDSDPKTLIEYECSLAYWERFTGDPPLDVLQESPDHYTSQYLAGLRELKGRKANKVSRNTVRKHVRQLQTLLYLAGPRSSRQPKGQGVLSEPPFLTKPPLWRKPAEDSFTVPEIGNILEACAAMKRPRLKGITACTFWRSVISFAYNTGQRRQLIFGFRPAHVQGEWLDAPAEICKGNQPRRIYLNEPARAAIAAMNPGSYERVFFWPRWPRSARWLQENLRRLLVEAGIPLERRFGFHALRKAFATELGEVNPLVVQMMLGHSTMKTTRESYSGSRMMANVVDQLTQPRPPDDRRQMKLF